MRNGISGWHKWAREPRLADFAPQLHAARDHTHLCIRDRGQKQDDSFPRRFLVAGKQAHLLLTQHACSFGSEPCLTVAPGH